MAAADLSPWDLSLAAVLILVLVVLSWRLRLGLSGQLVVAAMRTTIQLLLIGLVLKKLFAHVDLIWVVLMAFVMLAAAGREVMGRQKRKFTGIWGFGMGTLAMFISSFSVTFLALSVIISPQPWFAPQYAIPLLGMLLGNTMNGIAISLDRLTASAWAQRQQIEGRLLLGDTGSQAIDPIRKESIRSGLIPIINAMMAAGLVSLPGMMTGQILGGNPPMVAVKYQILIMFLIAGGTGLGTMAAVWFGSRRLFDDRERLRLDRLKD